MERKLAATRTIVTIALSALMPTIPFLGSSRIAVAIAVVEAAILASATAYAVYLGIYLFPRE